MSSLRKYFEGIRIKGRQVHVGTTGAVITVDAAFLKGLVSVLKIFGYFKLRQLKQIFSQKPASATIAFHPQNPGPWFNIWQVTRLGGVKTVTDLAKADYIFAFEDSTQTKFDTSYLSSFGVPVLNMNAYDISKEHVADVFEDVFGYNLRIDPLKHNGLAIQKSDANGTHDGMVITCPIDPSEVTAGQSYQRLVDSTFNGETSEDLRVAYALGTLALVYHKQKPLDDRFGTHYLSVDVPMAEDVFSAQEITLITTFCQKMHLDFGSIDVMRDKHDGRIYIVDVNKTCMPVLCLSLKTQINSQKKIAKALSAGLSQLPTHKKSPDPKTKA